MKIATKIPLMLLGVTLLAGFLGGLGMKWQFAMAAVAILFTVYIDRSICKPLRQLTEGTTGCVAGWTELEMPASRRDEVGEIATAFNSIIRSHRQVEHALLLARAEVEMRVTERTSELAKANARLSESEENFRQLANNVTDLFWITSADMGKIHYINDEAYERIWGRSAESLYSHPRDWAEAILPEDVERVSATFALLMADTPEIDVDYRLLHTDGTIRWIHASGFQVRDAEGRLVRLTGLAADITKRKLAEEVVRQQQTELRVLFDLMPAMIWFKDTKNGILRVNKRVAEAAGKSVEEIEHKSCFELYPKEAARYYADDMEVIRSGVPSLGIVEQLRGPGGDERWIQTDKVPYFDDTGSVIGIVVMAQDITERRLAEATRDRLAAILESTPDMVSISDSAGRLLYLNRAGRRLLELSVDEDITLSVIGDFLPNAAGHRVLTEGVPTAMAEGTWSGEVVLQSRGGDEIPISQVILSHRNAEGKVEFLSTIMRDIRERKRLEAQLFQSQKMEMVGRLAGGIAHDFNTILTTIIGHAELISEAVPPGGSEFGSAEQIGKSARQAAHLTQQLLAFGRKQMLQAEILDLNAAVKRTELVVRRLWGDECEVRVVLNAAHPHAKADPVQIEEMLVEMALNARDAMPRGGRLTFETGDVTLDETYTSTHTDAVPGDYVMIAVTDTGTGLSKEIQLKIFEPFFTTKAQGDGVGMGLSMCYGIAKQIGGYISVYSELGRGTTFKVFLPRACPPANVSLAHLPAMETTGSGKETILLVEDDAALRDLAGVALQKLGYEVHQAADVQEAINVARRLANVDLLFTDVVMPGGHGKELASQLQTLRPGMKVLFTSAHTEEAIVHHGVLDSGFDFLQKPYTPSLLARKTRDALDKGRFS